MLSDGVASAYDEVPWLLDMMTSDETVLHGDEKLAAMTIVSEAAVRGSRVTHLRNNACGVTISFV